MINNKNILATICARGGSKGIKLKNIKPLNGKPLILYTLEIIKESKYIDDYVISTDSEKIIDLCKEHNYKIDFTRPSYLAKDKVSRTDAVKHAANWKIKNHNYQIIVDLGVASPFKTVIDVDRAIEKFIDTDVDRVTSVCYSERNPYYNMLEEKNGKIKLSKNPEKLITDRKDAPQVYDMNDAINVWSFESLINSNNDLNSENLGVYIMPKMRSIDIDEEYDLVIAETLIKGDLIEI